MLPAPDCSGISGAEYDSLLEGLDEAGDEAERQRAELGLAIYLLDFNYQLSHADFAAILDCPSGGERLARLQEAFRTVATAHASRARASIASRPMGVMPSRGSRRSWLAHPVN